MLIGAGALGAFRSGAPQPTKEEKVLGGPRSTELRHSKKEFMMDFDSELFQPTKELVFWCRVCVWSNRMSSKKQLGCFCFLVEMIFLEGNLTKDQGSQNLKSMKPWLFSAYLRFATVWSLEKSKNIVPNDWWLNDDLLWWKGKNTPQTNPSIGDYTTHLYRIQN